MAPISFQNLGRHGEFIVVHQNGGRIAVSSEIGGGC
jgi:hypothetical protein